MERQTEVMTQAQEHQQANPVKIAKPFMSEDILKSVEAILRSGFLVQGQHVKEFETKLATYLGCRFVLATNSGTAALHCAIQAVKDELDSQGKLPEAPEVVTTPLSFAATANAVLHAGCVPSFADVNPETFNLDPQAVSEKITDNTIAIEPVDVYGLPAELSRFTQLAASKHLSIVEDAAEAIGATLEGKRIGSISDLTCFSTYATKNLHTGEGGFVSTNNEGLAHRVEMIRSQGQAARYQHEALGYNFRMLEIVAALGIPQISILDDLNSRRRENALILKERLSGIDCVTFQKVTHPESHSWYMFAVLLDEKKAGMKRDALVAKLRQSGIEADASWPLPIHLQPFYRKRFGYKAGDYPNAESICARVFQLPIQPFLKREEVERVAAVTKGLLG